MKTKWDMVHVYCFCFFFIYPQHVSQEIERERPTRTYHAVRGGRRMDTESGGGGSIVGLVV